MVRTQKPKAGYGKQNNNNTQFNVFIPPIHAIYCAASHAYAATYANACVFSLPIRYVAQSGGMSTKTFVSNVTFGALNDAQEWCRQNGYSYGSTCRTGYVALMRGDVLIAKWHNLTAKERAECDGVISGNFRDGPVTITIKP